jgi:hypothetical protein
MVESHSRFEAAARRMSLSHLIRRVALGSIPILIKTSLRRNCGLYLDCNDSPWLKPDIGYTIIEQPIVREGMRRAGRAVHVLEIDNFAR